MDPKDLNYANNTVNLGLIPQKKKIVGNQFHV